MRDTIAERTMASGQAVPDSGQGPGSGFLLQAELARRWRLSVRTLEKWRSSGRGPPYLKLGGRVVYRNEDILAYETVHLRLRLN